MAAFVVKTLGCKVNQYDSCAIASALTEAGLEPIRQGRSAREADLVVVNTCCVTATAMRKSRQAVRRVVRNHPGAFVFVVGCYSDYDAATMRRILRELGVSPRRGATAGYHDDLAAAVKEVARRVIEGREIAYSHSLGSFSLSDLGGNDTSMSVDIPVVGGAPGGSLHTYIRKRRKQAVKNNLPAARGLKGIDRFEGHQRAFVKVQDGCDAFCSYCVVPYTRWKVWSRSMGEVEDECRRLLAAGHKEIVLCGIFLGAFGRRTALRSRWRGPSKLPELLSRVASIEGLWRVRMSSLEPGDVTDELIAVCREAPQVAPHFHLPLQSGSQRIVGRMNRQYTVDEYRRTADRLKAALDRPAITTDIVVGFPGESEADFAETLAVARYCGFAKIHAFPFSPVAGTAAWTYRHEAPPAAVVKERLARLSAIEAELADAYRRGLVGGSMEGLIERCRPGRPGQHRAMTDRYQTVLFEGDGVKAGDVVRLRVTGVRREGLSGLIAG